MGKRKFTDPNAPKPYKTAYLHFSIDRRVELSIKHPTMDCQDVSRELGRLWKELSDSERRPWNELAVYDRARYEAEMKNYNNPFLREAALYEDEHTSGVGVYSGSVDPNYPKPCKSAYMHFWVEKREELLRLNPGIAFKDVAKEIGRVWRELDMEDKEPWIELAREDKRRFEEELAVYTPAQLPKVNRRRRDPRAPKGPKSGFQFLLDYKKDDMLAENPNMTYNAISQEIGRQWRGMSDIDRIPWNDMAFADKVRYQEDMLNYSPPKYGGKLSKQKRWINEVLKKDPNAPKVAKGAYTFFSSSKREEVQRMYPDMVFGDIMKKVGASWKALSREDKKPWYDLADADRIRYESELENYKAPEQHKRAPSKRKRPAGAPRPARSAFIHFQMAKREEVMEANPGMNYNKFTQEVSKVWRAMTEESKQPWRELENDDRARYEAEMVNYKATSCGSGSDSEAPKGNAYASMPKAAKSAFQYLFHDKKNELETPKSGNGVDDRASISKNWKPMPGEQRLPWLTLTDDDKTRYENEYPASYPLQLDHKKRNAAKRDPRAPRPAKSAFMYVLEAKKDDILSEHPHLSYNEISQEVGKIWHSMSEIEKGPWKDLAAEDKARYDAEMANYEPLLSDFDKADHKILQKHHSKSTPTGFANFAEQRQDEISTEFPELGYEEVSKRIGNIWNSMSDIERDLYVDGARMDRHRYDKNNLEQLGGQNAYV